MGPRIWNHRFSNPARFEDAVLCSTQPLPGATLFIDRSRRTSTDTVASSISERLKLQIPVLFFPEGTSTDGRMLKFHSSLFEPAIRDRAPVTPVAIRYVMEDGTSEKELCWF